MELHLKQWRDQHESEQQVSAKIPKLFLDPHQPQHQHQHQHQHQQHQQPSGSSALPLFVPELTSKVSSLSAFPDSTTRSFPRMGSHFSLAQWQELELQALIYRYMLAGAAVPPELLQPIKKSLLHSSPYFLHHPLQHYPHYQPALLQSGYWARGAVDPEPGRCRRTDGKKWRCSRDVVVGHKYCERHMHRGRNRSRKHVETPTTTSTAAANHILGGGACGSLAASATLKTSTTINSSSSPLTEMVNGPSFGLSAASPSIDLLHFNRSSSVVSKTENKGLFEHHNEVHNRTDGHILRHFFDDWPRPLQETNNAETITSTTNSATCLSISMPGNSSSDVSLKLSTGNAEEMGSHGGEREEPPLNWATGWAGNQVASMGGPLAEALRSSTSNSSPTSVLHQLHPRGSASETSFVST